MNLNYIKLVSKLHKTRIVSSSKLLTPFFKAIIGLIMESNTGARSLLEQLEAGLQFNQTLNL